MFVMRAGISDLSSGFRGRSTRFIGDNLKMKNVDLFVFVLLCIACVLRVLRIEGYDAELWRENREAHGYEWNEFGVLGSQIDNGLRTVLAVISPLLCIRPLELLVINNERLGMVFASSTHMLQELADFG